MLRNHVEPQEPPHRIKFLQTYSTIPEKLTPLDGPSCLYAQPRSPARESDNDLFSQNGQYQDGSFSGRADKGSTGTIEAPIEHPDLAAVIKVASSVGRDGRKAA